MNYTAIVKSSLRKNIKKYLPFLFTEAFSISLYFLYTTLIYNSGAVIDATNNVFGGILKASISIIIVILSSFTVYSYTSYIRMRSKEFRIMLRIGMTKKELTICVVFENLFLTAVCMTVGILLGTVFSKIFFLAVMDYLHYRNLPFSLGLINYLATLLLFIFLYLIITLQTRGILKHIGETYKSAGRKPERKITRVIKHVVLVLFVSADILAALRMQKWLFVWIACMILQYVAVFYLGRMLARLIKRKNLFYRRDFLVIKQLSGILEKDKVFIFILSFASFLFITYNWIAETIIFWQFASGGSDNSLKMFRATSVFAYVVFLAISSGIVYFKCQMELEDTHRYFSKLQKLGMTRKELDSFTRVKLAGIFFIPCTLCTVAASIFTVAVGMNFRFVGIIILLYVFYIFVYRRTRKLYAETYFPA